MGSPSPNGGPFTEWHAHSAAWWVEALETYLRSAAREDEQRGVWPARSGPDPDGDGRGVQSAFRAGARFERAAIERAALHQAIGDGTATARQQVAYAFRHWGEALTQLASPRELQVIEEHVIAGLTQEEVAGLLSCHVNTVSRLKWSALRKLCCILRRRDEREGRRVAASASAIAAD